MSKLRRQTYAAPIWNADYFMLRHIGSFVRPNLARIEAGETVLDAGCGEQPLRSSIEAVAARYVGLDVAQNRTGTVDVIAPLWKIPLEDGAVQTIVLTEVLEHVSDTAGAFHEMARILCHNGTVILTTPFAYPLHEEPHDYVRLTPAAIEWHARQSGFSVTESHALGNEIEVLAVTFGNLLSGMLGPLPFALRAAGAVIRLPLNVLVNGTAALLSVLLAPILPCKSYLSTACVLTRQHSP